MTIYESYVLLPLAARAWSRARCARVQLLPNSATPWHRTRLLSLSRPFAAARSTDQPFGAGLAAFARQDAGAARAGLAAVCQSPACWLARFPIPFFPTKQ